MSYVAVILAHPDLQNSYVNRALYEEIQKNEKIRISNLYAQYPDFTIDVAAEQAFIQAASAVVLQFPLYWYSCPALLKEWIDRVFAEGFAYGDNGLALKDKLLLLAITLGAEASFCAEKNEKGESNLFALSHSLLPFESTAVYCNMKWFGSFPVYGAGTLSSDMLHEKATAYRSLLESFL